MKLNQSKICLALIVTGIVWSIHQPLQSQEQANAKADNVVFSVVKTEQGQKLLIQVGDMVLVADKLDALHENGPKTTIKPDQNNVLMVSDSSKASAKKISVSLRNGPLKWK